MLVMNEPIEDFIPFALAMADEDDAAFCGAFPFFTRGIHRNLWCWGAVEDRR